MIQKPHIGIVIISWNGCQYLEKLLPSLFAQKDIEQEAYHVVIVDNGSTDGTTAFVRIYERISYIKLSKNEGFAKPNNIGIQYLFKTFDSIQKIVLLNNDTIVPPNFLHTLENGFRNAEKVGTVQTKISSISNPKIIDSVGITIDRSLSAINKGQGEKDSGQYEEISEIFGTTGSAMMISKFALETVALSSGEYFDNLYFAYQEDVDLAWRLRLSGFTAFYVPGEAVLHVHSATGKGYSAFKSFHIHRNTLFTIIKNMPGLLLWPTMGYFCLRYIDLLMSVGKKKGPAFSVSQKNGVFLMVNLVIQSWVSVVIYMFDLLKKRKSIQAKRTLSVRRIKELMEKFKADKEKMFYATST